MFCWLSSQPDVTLAPVKHFIYPACDFGTSLAPFFVPPQSLLHRLATAAVKRMFYGRLGNEVVRAQTMARFQNYRPRRRTLAIRRYTKIWNAEAQEGVCSRHLVAAFEDVPAIRKLHLPRLLNDQNDVSSESLFATLWTDCMREKQQCSASAHHRFI